MIDMDTIEEAEEIIREFQRQLYNLCEENISPTEVQTSFMVAGVMMKTAIEIYTSTLDEEDVVKVVDAIKDTIPLVAEKMKNELSEVTYH